MASKKHAKLNPALWRNDAHTLSTGTVITRKPTEVTATELKEVLEYLVNGVPVGVEVTATEAKEAEVDEAEAE